MPRSRQSAFISSDGGGAALSAAVSLYGRSFAGGPVGTKRKSNGEHELYERQAVVCKAFANSTRLQLVEMLLRGERWAAELQAGLGISKANLSQHLSVLKSAGVVATRREGKQLHCGIAVPEVKQAMGVFRNMLKAQGKESRRWS